MAAGAVSLRKSHDIVISSFCNIVKGQAKCMDYIRKTGKKTFGGLQLFSSVLSSKRSGDVMLFIFLF